MRKLDRTFTPRKLLIPAVIMLAFWALAVGLFVAGGHPFMLFNFGYIGTAMGVGLGLWAVLPKPKKPIGRRLTLFLIGGYLLFVVGFLGGEDIQIEGFFFALLSGMAGAALMHYFVAKILGPVLFGRLWCGWACWTVMVLDLLPFKRSGGRIPGKWDWLRYAHFGLSLGLALVMWFSFSYANEVYWNSPALLIWFLVGNLFYYGVGIGLAFWLKDNRAFCKYVCPVAVPLKLTSRFAMLKVTGDYSKCNECMACEKICPMNIRIVDYLKADRRVLSTECILCQTCISACAKDALKISFGFEVGGQEWLNERTEVTTGTKKAAEQEKELAGAGKS